MRIEHCMEYDDFAVVHGDPARGSQFNLTGVVRNEMHFLPVFLPYYRALGVDRFVFLDDQSDDGTTEFLMQQPDVVLLKSGRRFGDEVDMVAQGAHGGKTVRMVTIWRNILQYKFAMDVWALHLDVDEFLTLPKGVTLPDLVAAVERTQARAVWSVMLDMYPATIADLQAMAYDDTLDLSKPWYFDGERHLVLRDKPTPRMAYAGSRARMMQAAGLNPAANGLQRLLGRAYSGAVRRFNAIRKPVLVRWSKDAVMPTSHDINLATSATMLLPLRHFKFNGAVSQKIDWATQSKAYAGGSHEYFSLEALLSQMDQQNASFLYRKSRLFAGFEDFAATGNADGLLGNTTR